MEYDCCFFVLWRGGGGVLNGTHIWAFSSSQLLSASGTRRLPICTQGSAYGKIRYLVMWYFE